MNFRKLNIFFILIILAIVISSCSSLFFPANNSLDEQNKDIANFRNGEYVNQNPTEGMKGSFFKVAFKFLFENKDKRKPDFEIPTERIDIERFANRESKDISVIWLGHASTFINIEGTLILTDPMFSKYASPIMGIGPKRFFNSPIKYEDFPILDAVLISHNHYDHLDKESILSLNGVTRKFIVPLGVEKHLLDWGISADKIVIKNWWESFTLNNEIEIITTPAQHFSGRGLFDRNKTLWASFVIKSKNHSIYFGGDSGYFSGYKEIGEKYGPFDITILPIGAYNKMWKSIHMNPEEAVKAHIDLKGNLLLPIHWGTFDLALHIWNEPAERLVVASEEMKINIAIPKPGEVVNSNSDKQIHKWWILQNKMIAKEK